MPDKSADTRLNRIRRLGGVLKFAVLIYVIAPLCLVAFNLNAVHKETGGAKLSMANHPSGGAQQIPVVVNVIALLGCGLFLLGVISFYRLLNLYEKGVILSAANVTEMKKLGGYLIGYGLLNFVSDLAGAGVLAFPWVLIEIIASPWVVVGGAIILVAWVMEEGRKIREEQELTV